MYFLAVRLMMAFLALWCPVLFLTSVIMVPLFTLLSIEIHGPVSN